MKTWFSLKEESRKYVAAACILAAVALSLYTHAMVFSEWHMPTYGNTMIHVANARHLVEHGYYPLENDYSYGGGIPNIYVPIYRFLAAELVTLTGLSFDLISRIIVVMFAALVPLAFYSLGKALFNDLVGVLAAFFASLVPELLIYTVRPLPQGLGLALLPLGYYFLFKQKKWGALAFAALVSLSHQEAGFVYAASVFTVFAALTIVESVKARKLVVSKLALLALSAWLVAVFVYLGWQFASFGDPNIFKLAQFTQHEGGKVSFDLLYSKTGKVVTALSVIGVIALFATGFRKLVHGKEVEKEVFILALFITGIILVKNDLIGLNVFMDRFIVFLNQAMILAAAFALAFALDVTEKISRGVKTPQALEFG